MWPTNKTISSKDIADGLENTLMLIELRNSDIPWAEPRDITFDEFNKLLKNDPDKAALCWGEVRAARLFL